MSLDPTEKPSQFSRRHFLKCAAVGVHSVQGISAKVFAGIGLSVPAASAASVAVAAAGPATPTEPDSELLTESLSGLDPMESRRLHLVNAHTWDDLDVVYYTHGIYIDENIHQLDHLMRDRRANVTRPIDPDLYDQLLSLQKILSTSTPVHVLSGYRTPETNAKLRRRSSGVAKYSLHMEGRAADIYIPGISAKKLQAAALEMGAGGVGLYSISNFVHVDTGPVRQWGS